MTAAPRRPLLGRVSVRFALAMAAALVPLGAVSIYQTSVLQQEAQKRAEAALFGEVLAAASHQIDTIREVRGVLLALAQVAPRVIDDVTACSRLMARTAAGVPEAVLVAYVPADGKMRCSHNGRAFDFAGIPLFQELVSARTPDFVVNRNGPVSGKSVLGISHPVFAPTGEYLGFVVVSLPHEQLERMEGLRERPMAGRSAPITFWTFDGKGTMLTSTLDMAVASLKLPQNRTLARIAATSDHRVFNDVAASGIMHTYSVTPLVEGQLYLMGTWDAQEGSFLDRLGAEPFLPPVIMWIVGMIVAAAAAEWMVARPLRQIHRSIVRFAAGDRSMQRLQLDHAPVEFAEMGEAYMGMTESIMMGEAKLEDSVHQKEVLLREVHHRVKNNLQLIASIMNMQIRKAQSPESRRLLKGLQDRVMSLATIHRGLYQTSGLVDVRADELLGDIARQIVNMSAGPGRRLDLVLALEEIRLTPDQAVPLSLLLTEAMTNAIKYSDFGVEVPSRIEVRLSRDAAESAILEVVNDIRPVAAEPVDSTGLGQPLLTAFAQQLGGSLTAGADDSHYRLSVRFAVQALGAQTAGEAEEAEG